MIVQLRIEINIAFNFFQFIKAARPHLMASKRRKEIFIWMSLDVSTTIPLYGSMIVEMVSS